MRISVDHPAGTRQQGCHCSAESECVGGEDEGALRHEPAVREVSRRELPAGQVQPDGPACGARAVLAAPAPRDGLRGALPSSPWLSEPAWTLCAWAAETVFGAVSPQILLFWGVSSQTSRPSCP